MILAGNLGSKVVGADSDMRGVDEASRSVGNTVGSSSVGQRETSIEEELRVGVSRSLAIVVETIGMSIGQGHTLGHRVQALGDGVQSSAGAEGNSSSVGQQLRIGIGRPLVVEVTSSTWDWDIGSVDTGS